MFWLINPAINGPKTGPLKGQKAMNAIGGPTSELMNMSLTVPPEMERKAEPANPVMNLKIRWTAVISLFHTFSFLRHIRYDMMLVSTSRRTDIIGQSHRYIE